MNAFSRRRWVKLQVENLEDRFLPAFGMGFGSSFLSGPVFTPGNVIQPPAVVNLVVPATNETPPQGPIGDFGSSNNSPPLAGIISPPTLPGSNGFTFVPPTGIVPGPGWPIPLPITPPNGVPPGPTPPALFVNDAYFTTSVGQTLTVDAANGLLANAFDPSGGTLTITAVNGNSGNVGAGITLGSGASLTVNADGSLTYVPAAGFKGDDSFTFTAGDGTNSANATATINVQAPYLSVPNSYFTTPAGQTLSVDAADGLLAGAFDSSGNSVQVTAINGASASIGTAIQLASGATLTVNADGSFTYVPAAGSSGPDNFSFTASDGTTSTDATATIDVQAPFISVNQPYYTASTGQTLNVDASNGLLSGAYDSNGNTLTVAAVNGSTANVGTAITLGSGAVLTVNADGSFTYVPGSGFQGSDSFTFTVSDGTISTVATATINVQAPFISVSNAYFTTATGQTLNVDATGGLLANAYDSNGNTLTITAVNGSTTSVGTAITLTSGATLTVNSDGSFTYVPAAGFKGDDSFTFTASDGTASATATATIAVQTPFISVDNPSYTTSSGQTLSVDARDGLLSGAYDSSGSTLTVTAVNGSTTSVGTAVTLSSGASLTVNSDGSFTYVPAAGFKGADSFTFTVNDGTVSTDATATITVQAPFLFVNNPNYATPAGQTLNVDSGDGLLSGADDSSGNTLTITAVNGSTTSVGTAVTLSSGATLTANSDGSFSYVPAVGFSGSDSFTFTVSDGTISTDATATINVITPRLFVKDAYYGTPAGTTLTVNAAQGLLANVIDPSATSANVQITAVNGSAANVGTAITLASGATLTVNADGSFTYVPAAGFKGPDSFTFTAGDGAATGSATAHINVTALSLYLPPNVFYFDANGQTLNVDASTGLLSQAKDPTGGTLQVTAVNGSAANVGTQITLSSGASLTVNADGSFAYVPASNSTPPSVGLTGTPPTMPPIMPPISINGDSFTFTVSDGTLTASATATIVSVNPTSFPTPPEPPIPIDPFPPTSGSGGWVSGSGPESGLT